VAEDRLRVFLSYSGKDKPVAERLRSDLAGEEIQVWDPQIALRPGESWAAPLMKGVEEADAVVVLVSSHTESSQWQASEIAYALSRNLKEGKTIIPVLLDTAAPLPFFLREIHAIDLSTNDSYQRNLPRLFQALRERHRNGTSEHSSKLLEMLIAERELLDSAKKQSARAKVLSIVSLASSVLGVLVSVFSTTTLAATGWRQIARDLPGPVLVAVVSGFAAVLAALLTSYFRTKLTRRIDDRELRES